MMELGGDTRRAAREHGVSFDLVFPIAYAIVYALVVLWLHIRFFPIGDVGVESDFYQALAGAAQELLNGNLSVASYPYKGPFYSFALAFVHLFGGDWYTNAIVLNALCGAGSILVLYRLLLRVFNRWVAVSATVSVSLVAELFVHAHKASSDLPFFFLCFLAIGALLVKRPLWLPLVGSAVLTAFAFLTRYNGIYLAVVAAIVILFINPWNFGRGRRLAAIGVYAAVFLLVCAPWFVLNLAETGEVLSTGNLSSVTTEFYGNAGASGIPGGAFRSIGALIAHDPLHFVSHYLLNIPRHLLLDVAGTVGFPTGILMVLGLLLLLIIPPTRMQWAFYSFGIGYFLSMCMVFWTSRFAFPAIPMYVVLGFSLFLGSHGERRSRLGRAVSDRFLEFLKRLTSRDSAGVRAAVSLVVAAVILSQVLGIVRSERFYFDRRPLFILPAAQFLREHAERAGDADKQTVMARKPHIAYYSGMEYRTYPTQVSDGRGFIVSAIELDADYVVYSKLEHTYYPEADWLANLEIGLGVELVYSEKEINIYELSDWLDLESQEGVIGLEERLARLQDLGRADHQEAVMRSCAEISLLHTYNRNTEKAGEYLLCSLEAASKLPNSEDVDRGVRALWNELLLVADTYSDQGRRDEGAALVARGLELVDTGRSP